MKLADKLIALHEGGKVAIPLGLRKKVVGEAKSVIMGKVLYQAKESLRIWKTALRYAKEDHEELGRMTRIVDTLETFIESYKGKFKARKGNVRKRPITITPEDMKPYNMENSFNILLTTNSDYSKGDTGKILVTKAGPWKPMEDVEFVINYSSIGGTLDVLKVLDRMMLGIGRRVEQGGNFSDPQIEALDTFLPQIKQFRANIRNEIEKAQGTLEHEMVHVIQQQTQQGFKHKDLRKEGGYTSLRGKVNQKKFDAYSIGAIEVKAYLVTFTDTFMETKWKADYPFNDAVKEYVAKQAWFQAFKKQDPKRFKQVVRDFTLVLKKDRRFRKFKK